jgi:hypothetical protein
MKIDCLFCGQPIVISSRTTVGEKVSCKQCKTVFRVAWLYPLEIDWLEMEDKPDAESVGKTSSPDDLV